MHDTADEVRTNNTLWTLIVNKDGQALLDTDGKVKTNKTFWTLLMK